MTLLLPVFRVLALLPLAIACGDDHDTPVDVVFGETTVVVVVNPTVNDANTAQVPPPGSARVGVAVSPDTSASATTDADGVAVLAPVAPGLRTFTLSVGGAVTLDVVDQDLREIAVATDGNAAALMADVRYEFGGQVVEVTPALPIAQVNAALAASDTIVFFREGIYVGDLEFAGSNVTLFGEGPRGGRVTIDGNVTVSGSGNRLRGAVITGTLTVPGSNAGISFSHVRGAVDVAGSAATLLENVFCTGAAITGSSTTALGNAGMSPIATPSDGC